MFSIFKQFSIIDLLKFTLFHGILFTPVVIFIVAASQPIIIWNEL